MYDFSGLTNLQEWLLLYQGWHIGQRWPDGRPWVQPTRRMVKKLLERGLMTAREVKDRGLTVVEYDVPLTVHAAYCLEGEAA